MKIIVVGSGGREHAIIKKLKESPKVSEIFALPGNGGIAADATCVDISAMDIPAIVRFAKDNAIDYAVVAPDDPLVAGCVDALEAEGIPCFGPRANAAIIEGSKVFAKNLMKQYGIPTARYETFDDAEAAFKDIIAAGYEETMLYERKPKSLAEVEKMLGKKAFAEVAGAHVMRPPGKPALAEESDKRPSFSPAATDFAGVT